MLFSELPLDANVLKGIEALGFTTPTPVQQESIPLLVKENRDLIGLAQTGTGKTAAFGLPMIHKIDVNKKLFKDWSLHQLENYVFKYQTILKIIQLL